MVKWEVMQRPKDYGGLGFIDVRIMNTCLLAKWIDRLERGDNTICGELLRKKYLGEKSIYQVHRRGGSQFWRGLVEAKQWFEWGRKMKIKSGAQTRFWKDVWIGETALKTQFPRLYQCCADPEISVEHALTSTGGQLTFRRTLGPREMEEWRLLLEQLSNVQLEEGRDELTWCFEKSGQYSTKSLYQFMANGGVSDPLLSSIWKCRVPLKIQIFMWMTFRDSIHSKVQLKKRNWAGQECKLCGREESTDHLLFQCPVACFLWVFIKESVGWPLYPSRCEDLCVFLRDVKGAKLLSLFVQERCGCCGKRGMTMSSTTRL